MAKVDGDSPNSDELKPHGDEPLDEEPDAGYADLLSDDLLAGLDAANSDEAAAGPTDDMPAESPIVEEGLPEGLGDSVLEALGAEAGAQAAAEEPKEEAKEEEAKPHEEKKHFKLPRFADLGAAAVISLILVALAAFHLLYFSTALYVIALGLIPFGIWKGGEAQNIYTVILGCALAAILTAAYCMWIELGRYDLDIKARGAKQRVAMSPIRQFGPANTTATAWPAAVRLTSSAPGFDVRSGSPEIT